MSFALIDTRLASANVAQVADTKFDVHPALLPPVASPSCAARLRVTAPSETDRCAMVAIPAGAAALAGDTAMQTADGSWSFTAPTPAAAAHTALIAAARAALDASDTTILRCVEHGVAVPAAWATYRVPLRAIVAGTDTTSTALPARPDYPAGT